MKNKITIKETEEKRMFINSVIHKGYGDYKNDFDRLLKDDVRQYLIITYNSVYGQRYLLVFDEENFIPSIKHKDVRKEVRKKLNYINNGNRYIVEPGTGKGGFIAFMLLSEAKRTFENKSIN